MKSFYQYTSCLVKAVNIAQTALDKLTLQSQSQLPSLFRIQLSLLQTHLAYLFDVVATLDKQIEQCHQQNTLCQCIGKIPGIGPITASALIAGDRHYYRDSMK